MSRIESEELSMMDIEWYGVDRKGKIAVFCSAGIANIPGICMCRQRATGTPDCIIRKVADSIRRFVLFLPVQKKNLLPFQVAETFSGKGFFYYDSDDHSKSQ